ncbi:hypothetical protein [Streptosporangium sp. NPDC000396]|uniref:hypothetical protein n=1 Tax=Streptosporangium sp. NPDC000396 TaxID=3366185 RepID=UPI003691249C
MSLRYEGKPNQGEKEQQFAIALALCAQANATLAVAAALEKAADAIANASER